MAMIFDLARVVAEYALEPQLLIEIDLELVNWGVLCTNPAAIPFLKKYPDDAHRWDAKIVALMTATQLQNFGGAPVDAAASLKEVETVLAAPDATPATKAEAAYLHVQFLAQGADTDKPETIARRPGLAVASWGQ